MNNRFYYDLFLINNTPNEEKKSTAKTTTNKQINKQPNEREIKNIKEMELKIIIFQNGPML
jgi:hypothetical protein